MELPCYCEFGGLKSGDKFVWQGQEFEKVSGNFADRIIDGKSEEIPETARVYFYEAW